MKRFLMTLTVALALTVSNVSAAELTTEQLGKVFTETARLESPLELGIDAETFRERFNWFIVPIVQDGMNKDDVSELLPLFVIRDFDVSASGDDKIFSYVFGYKSVAVVGCGSAEEEHLKILRLCYATPENQKEAVFTSWLLTGFVGSLSTEIDIRTLMSELTAEGSTGSVVRDGLKFTVEEDGNLNILTAVGAQ